MNTGTCRTGLKLLFVFPGLKNSMSICGVTRGAVLKGLTRNGLLMASDQVSSSEATGPRDGGTRSDSAFAIVVTLVEEAVLELWLVVVTGGATLAGALFDSVIAKGGSRPGFAGGAGVW